MTGGDDIILTGIPRSGTTLCCHLLNRGPHVVALHEPMAVAPLGKLPTRAAMLAHIAAFFAETRRGVTEQRLVPSKHVNGEIPDNPFTNAIDPKTGKRLRLEPLSSQKLPIDRPLEADYALVIKHPAIFTALLGEIVGKFPAYAVVRNPLAVLLSWNSLDIAVSHGHAPAAESVDGALAAALAGMPDPTERQIFLLNWFFAQYHRFLPSSAIIRYEDLVASGGLVLSKMVPKAARLRENLSEKNDNPVYDQGQTEGLMRALLACAKGEGWRRFYSEESLRTLGARRLSRAGYSH